MKMVSTKMSAEEAKEQTPTAAPDMPKEQYPYGMRVTLDDEVLGKLGFKVPPAVGKELTMQATVKVVACSINADEYNGGEAESRCELQIIEVGFGKADQADPKADALYPKTAKK